MQYITNKFYKYIGNNVEAGLQYGKAYKLIKVASYKTYSQIEDENGEMFLALTGNLIPMEQEILIPNQSYTYTGQSGVVPCNTLVFFKEAGSCDNMVAKAIVVYQGKEYSVEYNNLEAGSIVGRKFIGRAFKLVTIIAQKGSKVKCYNPVTKNEYWLERTSLKVAIQDNNLLLTYDNKGRIVDKDGNEYKKCYFCGKYHLVGDMLQGKNGFACQDCVVTNNVVVCDKCGKFVNTINKVHYKDGKCETWCNECAERNAVKCKDCGKYFADDTTYVANHGQVCSTCRANTDKYAKCQDCGNYFLVDDLEEAYNGKMYCSDCIEYHQPYDGRVLNYHEKYDLDFFGKDADCHFGIELEIDEGGESSNNSRKIWKAIGEDHAVMMHDGSLDDGFEIVSAPATYEAHMNIIKWKEAMDKAKELGYRSHQPGTCGLHIHCERKYFGDIDKDLLEDKFAMLFANNVEWIKKFSRRRNFEYCHIDEEATWKTTVEEAMRGEIKAKPYKGGSHSVAVNYGTDKPTIEIRIFRGTLNYNTFVATLQFVQMFCLFLKKKSTGALAKVSLADFIKLAKLKKYNEFLIYLTQRDLY